VRTQVLHHSCRGSVPAIVAPTLRSGEIVVEREHQPFQTVVSKVRPHHRFGSTSDAGCHHRHEHAARGGQFADRGNRQQVRISRTHPNPDQLRHHDVPFAQFATKRATAAGCATGWVCRNEACTPPWTKPSAGAPAQAQAGWAARAVTVVRWNS
jgi:hypothetical protein